MVLKAKTDFLWYKQGEVIDESKELAENVEKWKAAGHVFESSDAPAKEEAPVKEVKPHKTVKPKKDGKKADAPIEPVASEVVADQKDNK